MGMNVISKRPLQAFWEKHADAREPLEAWYKTIRSRDLVSFEDLRTTFPYVDHVGPDYLIFNIKGNRYRLITRVKYVAKTLWIKDVLTHDEYSAWTPGD
ncbi:type II toxin-antitoxin system HigB family toxin [Deinococcus peraridilitoris]|uniref:Type II toxin-antitoxin system HigB family toxin n=1 Tax=Deinococcus peraridilitoris (strain DSM 19664 / LMG 22246 / CIP 109416 / KR-200) TaxID=937777 RepID=L0A1J4_DEIPD|nr:type II toxin-antitoxin system HigB family toxin [Deinococcus peraridilitoris]AFZ67768.1 hypothetical protein Deipe_2287 [Deinococcus peraridilitoris DSM 19664]